MQKPIVATEVMFRGTPSDVIWRSEVTRLSANAKIYSRKDCDIIFLRKGAFLGAFNDRDEFYLVNDQKQGLTDKLFHGLKYSDECEIFYINRLAQLENRWGTPDRVEIYDKDYDLHTTVGANGTYKFSIQNSMKLFSKIQGSAGSLSQDSVRDFFRSELNMEIRNAIATVFYKNKFGLKDIATITMREKEVSEGMKEILIPVFAEYGVSLDKFYIARFMYDEDFLGQISDIKKDLIINKMKYEGGKHERKDAVADFKLHTKAELKLKKIETKPNEHEELEIDKATETQTKLFCWNCGTANDKTRKTCSECKAELKVDKHEPNDPDQLEELPTNEKAVELPYRIFCTVCGAHNPKTAKKCSICGTKFGKKKR